MMRGTPIISQRPSVAGVAAASSACQAEEAQAAWVSSACLYTVKKGCGRGTQGQGSRTVGQSGLRPY